MLCALVACKADSPPSPSSGSATGAPPPRPSPDATLRDLMPTIEGVKELHVATSERAYTAYWCFDAPDAIDQITSALRKAGWDDVRTKGQPPKIAIAGKKGDVRFSARTGPTDSCAGTYVIAWVARIGPIEIPPGGEPIR